MVLHEGSGGTLQNEEGRSDKDSLGTHRQETVLLTAALFTRDFP